MTETIGNPLSWVAGFLGRSGAGVAQASQALGGYQIAPPVVRRIGVSDIRAALKDGLADFSALRTDVVTMCLLYPLIGVCLFYVTLNRNLLPLAFPLASGFALLGPLAAVGLYEMSRRRGLGEEVGWLDGFRVLKSPGLAGIVVLGLMLVGTFALWLLAAWGIFLLTMGPEVPASAGAFLNGVLATGPGWAMILIGIPVGFVFAAVVLMVAAFSFPLLIDRPVGLPLAVVTSVAVARENPGTVALWGLIVATLLLVGSIPLLLGLAIVLPILGHATWHLYRRAVG
jgi:uncharacterized membrane protein